MNMILKKLIQKMKTNTKEISKMENEEIVYDRFCKVYWVGGHPWASYESALEYLKDLHDKVSDYEDTCVEPVEQSEDEKMFEKITHDMLQTYIKKNRDYGGAFERGMERDGMISALTRMYDKLDRLHSLKDKDPEVVDETVEDTLMDLANYAIMTLICTKKMVQKMVQSFMRTDGQLWRFQKMVQTKKFRKSGTLVRC